MSNPCGCVDTSSKLTSDLDAAQDPLVECPATVHETVCIQAEVTITPLVTVGDISSFCVGNPSIGACSGTTSPTNSCTFSVSQSICVAVPLTFSADATATPNGIVCGTPAIGDCP